MAARSEPQMPLRDGSKRTQSRAGSSGSGTSPRCSIERALVATSGRPPDALTIANEGIDRWKVNASNDAPFGPSGHLPGERGGHSPPSPSHRLSVLVGAWVWHREAPVSWRHTPALDAPSALARDLREAGVGVHSDRRAHKLEHAKGRQRVRVRKALSENDAVAAGVLLKQRAASLTRRGWRLEISCEAAILIGEQVRAGDLNRQEVRQRFYDDIERPGEQQHPMAGPLVLADAPHAFRIDPAQRHRVEGLSTETL